MDVEQIKPSLEETGYGTVIKNVKQFQAGAGNETAQINQDGFFIGSEKFSDAPFRVGYDGAMVAESADVTGDINATGGVFSGDVTVGTGTPKVKLKGTDGTISFLNGVTEVGALGVESGWTHLSGVGTDLSVEADGDILISAGGDGSSTGVGITYEGASADFSVLNSTTSKGFFVFDNGDAAVDGDLYVTDDVFADTYNDFAEFFEATIDFSNEKIPLGTTVVLDNGKIRPALLGESPIGAISATAAMILGAGYTYQGRYERDEYGRVSEENAEVWVKREKEGKLLRDFSDKKIAPKDARKYTIKRKVERADYDPTREYVKRIDRPEWNIVGLIGKVRINKGQPVADNWIKMREVSEDVDEWFIK